MRDQDGLSEPLTPRELDILAAMVEGLAVAQIAARLVLAEGTVKWYIKQLYAKLAVHTREEAVLRALALGLVAPPAAAGGNAVSLPDHNCPLINPLPQDVTGRYVGNAPKRTHLADLLRQGVRLISIYGRAGSGKTALACQALSDLRQSGDLSPRLMGIVSLSAIGLGITLDRILMDVGRLLSERDQAVLATVARSPATPAAQKTALLLEKIAGRKIVLLLDNLETLQRPPGYELTDPELQQFIEMAVAQSSALTIVITSRAPLALPRTLKTWEHVISLGHGLPSADAVTLLRNFDPSGVSGLRDAPAAELVEIARRLGGFPRALEAVAGILLEDPLLDLGLLQRSFDDLQGEISAAVVEQALAQLDDQALQVLQGLAIFGQPVRYAALEFLLMPYLPDATLRAILARLMRACFVQLNRAAQQLGLHPLDQAYCYTRIPPGHATAGAAPAFTRAALHRRAAQFFATQRLPQAEWRQLSDLEPQLQEFTHWRNAGDADAAARVLLAIDPNYLWEWGYKDQLRTMYAQLAGTLRDARVAHQVARRQAWLKFFEQPDEADREFTLLLDAARRQGFLPEEADALNDLAQTFRRAARDLPRSVDLHQQALAICQQIGYRQGEAEARGGLGMLYAELDAAQAIGFLLPAAAVQRELGNSNSLSFVLAALGIAYYNLDQFERAIDALEEALQVSRAGAGLEAQTRAYGNLARVCARAGKVDQARAHLEAAAALARDVPGETLAGNVMFWIAHAAPRLALAGDADFAVELMARVMQATPTGIPGRRFFADHMFALALLLRGDFRQARGLLPADIATLTVPWLPHSWWIGVLLIKTGEPAAAAELFDRILKQTLPSDRAGAGTPEPRMGMLPLPVQALAHAGLALIHHDPARVAAAEELVRRSRQTKDWFAELNQLLFALLLDEPGSEILAPLGLPTRDP